MSHNLSCGIILLNEVGELLLAHATNTTHWDIPKGGPEDGESRMQTALRETKEEIGINLEGQPLLDLGEVPYRPEKSLHLFAARILKKNIDTSKLTCSTYFEEPHTGRAIPETDAYDWVPPSRLQDFCSKSLYKLFATKISLFSLHEQLA